MSKEVHNLRMDEINPKALVIAESVFVSSQSSEQVTALIDDPVPLDFKSLSQRVGDLFDKTQSLPYLRDITAEIDAYRNNLR